MGRARLGSNGLGGPTIKLDVDSELAALDLCLGGFKHPVPALLRKRVLQIATGIIARAPAPECPAVNARLRSVLRRHGIFCNSLRPR